MATVGHRKTLQYVQVMSGIVTAVYQNQFTSAGDIFAETETQESFYRAEPTVEVRDGKLYVDGFITKGSALTVGFEDHPVAIDIQEDLRPTDLVTEFADGLVTGMELTGDEQIAVLLTFSEPLKSAGLTFAPSPLPAEVVAELAAVAGSD